MTLKLGIGGIGGIVCPTIEVAAVVRRTMDELPEGEGLKILSKRIALVGEMTSDGGYRRLRNLFRHYPPVIKAKDADVVVLACGSWLEMEPIAHLPTSLRAAREMVRAHAYATGAALSGEEINLLASRLHHFTQGYLDEVLSVEAESELEKVAA